MTAQNKDVEITRKDGIIESHPVLAGEILYKGRPVFAKAATGLAFTNDGTTETLADGDVFLGICVEGVDNSAGQDGDLEVRVYTEGLFEVPISDTISLANVGDKVFVNNATDNSTMTITSDTGNPEVTVGEIKQFVSANKARIQIAKYVGGKADSSVGSLEIEDNAITAAKIAAGAVTTAKIGAAAVNKDKLSYEVIEVTVAAGQTAGTGTATAGGIILGIYPSTNQDQFVDNVALVTTTLTVTLAAAATADNKFKVVLLKA